MNTQPLITVIIPVYNTAPYLRKCLDSVCGQTYTHLEIICVDDGSTDDSASILKEYAARDARIKVILQENQGVSVARNAALKIATGEYVTGVDSDDYLELNTYEWVISKWDAAADVVCYGTLLEGGDEDKKAQMESWLRLPAAGWRKAEDMKIEELNDCFWNKLWRREFLCSIGVVFPEGLRYEDSAFSHMAIPLAKDFFFVPEKLYHYVQRGESFMHSHGYLEACKNKVEIMKIVFNFYQRHGIPETLFLNLLSSYTEGVIKMAPLWERREIRQIFRALCMELGLEKDGRFASQYPVPELIHPWLRWNPFYRRDRRKKSYKFFWIPVFTIRRKNGYVHYKLLGVRVDKRPCLSDSW